MDLKAIQILRSIDAKKNKKGKLDERKEIQVVKQCDGPSLEEILSSEDVKDIPILVFSVAGKTRGGKSFLLNLMIKYLESKEKKVKEDWLSGKVPSCFEWKNGIKSITRGLWIYPKIFRLKNCYGDEVGVLLMDMEGLYDGEITDGEVIAISGVSAAMSYSQMFNVKEKMTSDYLESVIRTLIKGIEELNSEMKEDSRNDFRIMFIVRDWMGEEDHDFGLEGGKEYIEEESKRGTKEHQELWRLVHETFSEVECVLLPDPGREVTRREFNESGKLDMLEKEFLREIKLFIEELFSPDKLIPLSNNLNGEGILKILKNVDGKVADKDLSFLHIFTEYANEKNVEKWRSSFEESVAACDTFSGLKNVKSEMSNILRKAERLLIGKSRTEYLTKLTEFLEEIYNKKVVEMCRRQYKNSIQSYSLVEKQHEKNWFHVTRNLKDYLCGNNTSREKAYVIFMKDTAAYYYKMLHKEHTRLFQYICSLPKTLEGCAGLVENHMKSFKQCDDFSRDLEDKNEIYPLWLKEYQSLKKETTNIFLQKIGKLSKMSFEELQQLRRKQYEHFESFTLLSKGELNFDSIQKKDKFVIAKKVGYAMFGPPENFLKVVGPGLTLPSLALPGLANLGWIGAGKENARTDYTKEQESKIFPIVDKIISQSSGTVKFSCVFLVYHEKKNTMENDKVVEVKKMVNVPIFRIKKDSGIVFIDSNCRSYTEWNDFLTSNTLPPDIVYCYPLNGQYIKTEGFGVAFSRTPASESMTKALKTGDTVGKSLTFVAGVASFSVLCGVAAPLVIGTAVVGGVVGGVYGAGRGVQKILDKKKHEEPIRFKDGFSVALNCLSVVGAAGMAAGRVIATAAEGATVLINGTKAAAGFSSGVNSLLYFLTNKDDTPKLISLIAEVEDNSLKMLFYFNTTCSKDALSVIRRSLKLEDNKNTVETLLALLENNCIPYASVTESEYARSEKYVSESTAKLVTSILTVISKDVRDVVLHYCKIDRVYQLFKDEKTTPHFFADEIKNIMNKLMTNLKEEIELTKIRLTKALCQNVEMLDESTFIQSVFDAQETREGHHIISAFRYLIWSLISETRKANNFFNNIEHEATTLKGHYLDSVPCHTLREISQQVQEIVHQTDSAADIKSTDTQEINNFISGILNLLKENSSVNWSACQFASFIINITKQMVSHFERIVCEHEVTSKKVLDKKGGRLLCDDLEILIEEIGLKGFNYGTWVSNLVLDELVNDVEAIENMANGTEVESIVSVTPAWGGVLDRLYYYHSKIPVNTVNSLDCFIECLVGSGVGNNYKKRYLQGYNLIVFKPCDEAILPSFIVFFEDNGMEGLIWRYEEEHEGPVQKEQAVGVLNTSF